MTQKSDKHDELVIIVNEENQIVNPCYPRGLADKELLIRRVAGIFLYTDKGWKENSDKPFIIHQRAENQCLPGWTMPFLTEHFKGSSNLDEIEGPRGVAKRCLVEELGIEKAAVEEVFEKDNRLVHTGVSFYTDFQPLRASYPDLMPPKSFIEYYIARLPWGLKDLRPSPKEISRLWYCHDPMAEVKIFRDAGLTTKVRREVTRKLVTELDSLRNKWNEENKRAQS